ncbi:hypothetical protein PR048_002386 [Dryococelus australis]|uniref:Uncharacterized protein n=1 Tax=Dryococelus australis TaxID=614101 RepID=A0ABQ9ILI4_9NEOP|nr:hypothetical protein PR048_002386 [Dryococelus australis]
MNCMFPELVNPQYHKGLPRLYTLWDNPVAKERHLGLDGQYQSGPGSRDGTAALPVLVTEINQMACPISGNDGKHIHVGGRHKSTNEHPMEKGSWMSPVKPSPKIEIYIMNETRSESNLTSMNYMKAGKRYAGCKSWHLAVSIHN